MTLPGNILPLTSTIKASPRPVASPPWIFRQLEGPAADRKWLILDDADAPHGRPRQKAIIKDKIAARQHTVHYSGSSEPTRHIFGSEFEPWELTGRFMNRSFGKNYAKLRALFVKGFCADNRQVQISWGDTISAKGFISSFEIGWESQAEIAWTMQVLIDADDKLQLSRSTPSPQPMSPKDASGLLAKALADALVRSPVEPEFFKGSLFDLLDSLVVAATSPFAALANLANQMDGFEQALIGDIRRFRAGVGQLKTALGQFRDTYQSLQSDLAVQGSYAEAQLDFAGLQSTSAAATLEAMIVLVEADRAAAIAERGKLRGFYEVRDGDTWEQISLQLYGSPERAGELRLANGAAAGADPLLGQTLQVPT